MKLLLVDFDGTLIENAPFVNKIFSIFTEKFNIQEETSLKILESTYDHYGITDWAPFYSKMAEQANCSEQEIKDIVYHDMTYISINKAVYELTKKFEGFKIIFSYGEYDFQVAKIKITKMDQIVDDLLITTKAKIDALKELIRDDTLIYKDQIFDDVTLIDDREYFLNQVKNSFPFIKIIDAKGII